MKLPDDFKNLARAQRRHHFDRQRNNRRYHYAFANFDEKPRPWLPGRTLGRLLRTPTPCSCWMCGNPRRKQKDLPIQERKADLYFRLDLQRWENAYYHKAS